MENAGESNLGPSGSPKSKLEQIATILNDFGVAFLVIGGQAELLYGSARVTYDIDLCYERSTANLQKLANAIGSLSPQLRDTAPELPFKFDVQSLSLGNNFTLTTTLGDLDLLGYVEPLGDYATLLTRAIPIDVDGVCMHVIGLDDLIRIKQYLGRPKDREALAHLLAIRDEIAGET